MERYGNGNLMLAKAGFCNSMSLWALAFHGYTPEPDSRFFFPGHLLSHNS